MVLSVATIVDSLPPNIKSLNYLNNILAKIEANIKGGNEAIILYSRGLLSREAETTSLLLKRGTHTLYHKTASKGHNPGCGHGAGQSPWLRSPGKGI